MNKEAILKHKNGALIAPFSITEL